MVFGPNRRGYIDISFARFLGSYIPISLAVTLILVVLGLLCSSIFGSDSQQRRSMLTALSGREIGHDDENRVAASLVRQLLDGMSYEEGEVFLRRLGAVRRLDVFNSLPAVVDFLAREEKLSSLVLKDDGHARLLIKAAGENSGRGRMFLFATARKRFFTDLMSGRNRASILSDLYGLSQDSDQGGDYYVSWLLKHRQEVLGVMHGHADSVESIDRDLFSPADFLKYLFLGSWLFFGLVATVEYLIRTAAWKENPLELPWKLAWVYFAAACMMSGIVVAAPFVWGIAVFTRNRNIKPQLPQIGFARRTWRMRMRGGVEVRSSAPLEERRQLFAARCTAAKENLAESRARFVRHGKELFWPQTASVERQIAGLKSQASSYGEQLQRIQRGIANKQIEHDKFVVASGAAESPGITDALLSDLELMLGWPSVAAYEISEDNTLHVYTNPIVIPYKGKRYEIGNFEIKISLLGAGCVLEVKNFCSTHPMGEQHPHQESDRATPHWCKQINRIHEHFRNGNLLAGISIIIQELYTYRPGQIHGGPIKEWKEVIDA